MLAESSAHVRTAPRPSQHGGGPPPLIPRRPGGSDGNGWHGEAKHQPPVSNAMLGMILFLGTDMMFFAALIGAFLVFRYGSVDWPPPGQPRLPVAVTGVNTLLLSISGYTMIRAWLRIRKGDQSGLDRALTYTAGLGALFLVVQGFEWLRLLHFGFTWSRHVYGAIFYTLIGCHALHVLGALVWLLVVKWKAARRQFTAQGHLAVQLCGIYWLLVVAIWPLLYTLVYLA